MPDITIDFESLKSLAQQQFDRDVREAKARLDRTIASLAAWERSETGGVNIVRRPRIVGKGELVKQIRAAIATLPAMEFTSKTIVGVLSERIGLNGQIKPPSVIRVLARLEKEGLISVKTQGAGRRATVYSLAHQKEKR